MKSYGFVAILIAMLVITSSCASQDGMPDPALIEAEIAEARVEEQELVRNTIQDPGRAEIFVGLLEERDRLLERLAKQHSTHRHQLAELSADYSAERREFERLLATFNHDRRSAQDELIDLVNRMKLATKADEWRTISAFQVKRVDPRQIVFRERAGER